MTKYLKLACGFLWQHILTIIPVICAVCAFYSFYSEITAFLIKWFVPIVGFERDNFTDTIVVCGSIGLAIWTGLHGPKRYSQTHIWVLLSFWFLFFNYAFTSDFVYTKVWGIPYFLFFLLLPSSGMVVRFAYYEYKRRQIKYETVEGFVQKDEPIKSEEDDYLGFSPDVKYIVDVIEHTESSRSTSIGLAAPWGTGKTSFLNLLKLKLDSDDRYIFVNFNPRGSAKVENIQTDFMNLLCDVMKQYHSSFTSYMKEYVSTLQLISEKNPLVDWISHLGIDSVEASKSKVKDVIVGSRKKLVVLIDDLDRLTAMEILEVLKLIDINSSFPNSFFITAYDKAYVNEVLKKELGYSAAVDYTDKYFSLEYALTEPSYRRKFDMLERLLTGALDNGVLKVQKQELSSALSLMQSYCETMLPNLRDIKRFYNQFISTYIKIGRDVDFKEYFAVSLIKYAHPDEYKKLALKNYLEMDYTHAPYNKTYVLNAEAENAKSVKLLEILFPFKKGDQPSYLYKDRFQHINYPRAFDTYFRGFEIGNLYHEDLAPLLDITKPLTIAEDKFRDWVTIAKRNDVVDYLLSTDFRKLDSEEQLMRYVQVLLIFTYVYGLDLNMSTALIGVFSDIHIGVMEPYYGMNKEAYKSLLESAISGLPKPTMATNFLNWYIVNLAQDKGIASKTLFKVEEISKIADNNLNKMIADSKDSLMYQPSEFFTVLEGCGVKKEDSPVLSIDVNSLQSVRELMIEHPADFASRLLTHITQYNDETHIYLGFHPLCHADKLFDDKNQLNLYMSALHSTIGGEQPYKTLSKYIEFAGTKPFEWHSIAVTEGESIVKGDYDAYYSLMIKE